MGEINRRCELLRFDWNAADFVTKYFEDFWCYPMPPRTIGGFSKSLNNSLFSPIVDGMNSHSKNVSKCGSRITARLDNSHRTSKSRVASWFGNFVL
jgi:hypothetical protein